MVLLIFPLIFPQDFLIFPLIFPQDFLIFSSSSLRTFSSSPHLSTGGGAAHQGAAPPSGAQFLQVV